MYEKLKNKRLLLVIATTSLFLVTRLYGLASSVPIFTDEAIYLRWVQIFIGDKHQFFISLTDGKQPLFIWLGYIFVKTFANPLLALRLVSVLAGLFALAGAYMLTFELTKNRKTAYIASLIYTVYPFSLVYDRLALYDSLLAAFGIWALYAEVKLVRSRSFKHSILLGLILAGAMLTKSSAFFFVLLTPASLLLFDFKDKSRRRNLAVWVFLVLVSIGIAEAFYAILRFSPNYHYITDKNYLFIEPVSAWIKHPLKNFGGNLRKLTGDLIGYTTVPLLAMIIISWLVKKELTKQKILLSIWFTIPFMSLVFLGSPTFLFPRYILFMTMPLLVLLAISVAGVVGTISRKKVAVIVLALAFTPAIINDFFIVTNFSKASIPYEDKKQLVDGFASGVGVSETVDYIKKQSANGPVYVATEGTFGLMPQALQVFLSKEKNIEIKGFWPISAEPPQEVLKSAQTKPTFFVFYAPCPSCEKTGFAPNNWPVKLVFRIKKEQPDTFFSLYLVVKKDD